MPPSLNPFAWNERFTMALLSRIDSHFLGSASGFRLFA